MKKNTKLIVSLAIFAAVVAIFVAVGLLPSKSPKEKLKVIFDCDMGYMNDDALALSMLLQAEEQNQFEVMGITLEGGNVFIDAEFESYGALQASSYKSTMDLLEQLGRTDIPVYRGTDYPEGYTESSIQKLADYYKNLDYLPDCDGYGAIHAFDSVVSGSLCDSDDAADFLAEAAKQNKGNLVIIAVGPTMNIARAIKKDSSFAANVKAVYYMGGAVGETYPVTTVSGNDVSAIAGANVTPYAEYNALYDPKSLYTCLTAGFKEQVISPGEMNVAITQDAAKAIKSGESTAAKLWSSYYENNTPEYPYWDPLTAYAFLYPGKTSISDAYITINTNENAAEYGETATISSEKYNSLSESEKDEYGKISIVTGVDDFWEEVAGLFD